MHQQKKTLLTILIVNYNTSDFVNISLYALNKLTKNNYQVIVLDNNSKPSDYSSLKKIVSKYKNAYLEKNNTNLKGSVAHGSALNHLAKKVNTPYFVILDADAIWLLKDWDQILINQLNDKIKAIGTQAPINSEKYQDFPLVFAMLFETNNFQKLNINCLPPNLEKKQDVCYELREKFLEAGVWAKNIEMKNTRTYKNGPFKNLICAEYYLNCDYEHIFVSHFGRGSQGGGKIKYNQGWKKIIYNIPLLGQYILLKKCDQEKNTWIKICKEIIDKQID